MNSIEPQLQAQQRFIYSQDDEIDLMELFAIVWGGKLLILGITLASAVVAYFFISALPSIYEVSASINEGSPYQLQSIQPAKLNQGDNYQVEPLSSQGLYNATLNQFDSLFVKKLFWGSYSGEPLSDIDVTKELTENEKSFLDFQDGLVLSIGEKDEDNPRLANFTLETKTPSEGIKTLKAYLSYLDSVVMRNSLDQLKIGFESNLVRLNADYKALKTRELIKLDDDIIRLKEAYNLAESLNIIETPYEQVENVESQVLNNRLYLLGTRAIGEELKSLEARREKPLGAFVPQLRMMELWQQQMENDLLQLKSNRDKVSAFVVVAPPESSLRPIMPKKALIFIASVFTASFLSLILVFILHGVRSYKARMLANG